MKINIYFCLFEFVRAFGTHRPIFSTKITDIASLHDVKSREMPIHAPFVEIINLQDQK